MNALSTITILPSSKQEKETFIAKAKEELLSGNYPIMDIYAHIDFIKKTLDDLMKDAEVKDVLENELSMYSEKSIDIGNFIIEKRSKSTYDYSIDMEYNRLKSALKARESFLKANKCNEDGEAIPINKTDYIAIKAK